MRINYAIIIALIIAVLAGHVFFQGSIGPAVTLLALMALVAYVISGIYA